jgi:hypothetical protein
MATPAQDCRPYVLPQEVSIFVGMDEYKPLAPRIRIVDKILAAWCRNIEPVTGIGHRCKGTRRVAA